MCWNFDTLSLFDKLSQEVVTYMHVLQIRICYGVNPHLNRTVVVLKNLDARVAKIGQKKTPPTQQEKGLIQTLRHRNILCLTR